MTPQRQPGPCRVAPGQPQLPQIAIYLAPSPTSPLPRCKHNARLARRALLSSQSSRARDPVSRSYGLPSRQFAVPALSCSTPPSTWMPVSPNKAITANTSPFPGIKRARIGECRGFCRGGPAAKARWQAFSPARAKDLAWGRSPGSRAQARAPSPTDLPGPRLRRGSENTRRDHEELQSPGG